MGTGRTSAPPRKLFVLLAAITWCFWIGSGFPLRALAGNAPEGSSAFPQPAIPLQAGEPRTGQKLFAGLIAFQAGGPPCAACHDVGMLAFPHGGSLGPDLTGIYTKYGPDALTTVLTTLYFPTMAPLFANRLLTPHEEADLAAFFKQAAQSRPSSSLTWVFCLLALGGLIVLVAVSWAWVRRNRPSPAHCALFAIHGPGGTP